MANTAVIKKSSKSTSMKKVAIVTLLGGAVEWYCFLLYGQAAGTIFNKVFFSGVSDPYAAQILSYLSFAIGYLARPFGAMFFGNYGDKLGRKFTVIASLAFMGVSTFAIGLIPSYENIGIAAPILLQVFRLTQCFGMGGKWGGGILMAFENADPKERAFYAAIPQMGLPVGLAFASLLLAIPSRLLPESAFLSYGWRISFMVSAFLIVLIMYIRINIMETDDFSKAQAKVKEKEKEEKKTAMPLVQMFKNYWKTLLLGIGTRWIDGVFYNVFAVFTLSYATQQLGVPQSLMYTINIIFALTAIPFIFMAGKLADKWGKGRLFCISSIACGLVAIPGLKIIQNSGGNPVVITLVIILGWSIFYSGIWGVLGSLWAQLFETEVRYSGISFVYHAPSFLVAGIVPTICTYLLKVSNGNVMVIGVFVAFVAVVSTVCGIILQRRHDQAEKLTEKNRDIRTEVRVASIED